MAGTLANLRIGLTIDRNRLRSSIAGAKTDISTGMRGAGMQGAASLSKGLIGGTAVVGLAMAAWGTKVAIGFEAAMSQSLAIQKDISSEMRADMEAAARAVGRETTFSSKDAAEAYYFLASAGMTAEQQLAAMPQVAKFAQAGMFDMARATDLLTDAQSALGLSSDDAAENLKNMQRVSDVLVKANTTANASVEQFATSLTSKAGSAMKAFNMDIEEGMAVLAAFADQGVKAELSGNALDRILRLLPDAAIKNAEAYKRFGIEVFDANGNMHNMADIIGDLETALDGMSDKQKQTALNTLGFQARVQGIIKPLLGTSEAIREYEDAYRGAGGTTDTVAAKQLENFSAQMSLFMGELEDIALTLGQALLPILTQALSIVKPIVAGFGEILRNSEGMVKVLAPLFTMMATVGALKFGKGMLGMLMPIPPGLGAGMTKKFGPIGTGAGKLFSKMFGIAAVAGMAYVAWEMFQEAQKVWAGTDAQREELADTRDRITQGDSQSLEEMKVNLENLKKVRSDVEGDLVGGFLSFTNIGGVKDELNRPIEALEQEIEDVENGLRSAEARIDLPPVITDEDLANMRAAQPEVEGALGGVAGAVEEGMAKVRRAFMRVELDESAYGGMRGMRHAFVASSMELIDSINTSWDRINSAVSNPPKLVSRGKRIKQYVKAINDIDKNLKKAMRAGDDVNTAYWATMKIDATQSLKEYKNTGTASAADIIARFKELNMKVPKFLRQMAASAKTETASAKSSMKTNIEGAKNAVTKKLQTAEANVQTSMTNMGSTIQTEGEQWYGYGASAGDQLIGGLDSKLGEVEAAGTRLAGAMSGPVHFSTPPSKGPLSKVREFMPHMIDHLIAGGEGSLSKAGRFGDRLGSGLSPTPQGMSMSMAGAGGGGGGGGGDLHVHIGTFIGDDRGIDQLARKLSGRKRMSSRTRWTDNELK